MASTATASTRVRFFLCRHGETDYNAKGIVQGGSIDSHLSLRGRRQADALGKRLSSIEFDVVASSPLARAMLTTAFVLRWQNEKVVDLSDDEILALSHSDVAGWDSVEIHDGLKEMDFGVLEGHPMQDVGATLREILMRWEAGESDFAVEAGESPRQVSKRSRAVLDSIAERHSIQNVLLVGHGRMLRTLLCSVLDEYGLHKMQHLDCHNTSVSIIEFDRTEKKFYPVLLNCTAHLGEGEVDRARSLRPMDLAPAPPASST